MAAHDLSFELHRERLFGLAYRMTGSVADSEDILQNVHLAWSREDRGQVRNPAAFLTRCVVNEARDLLGSATRRRETYVGPWLPEPLPCQPITTPSELAESLRMAFMIMLERLSADERAIFVLKEVFGYTFEEIAEFVDKSPAACRKSAERARRKVQAPRELPRSDPQRAAATLRAFLAAAHEGDVAGLTAMLREDAVFLSDGGGKVGSARKPLSGRKLTKFMVGIARVLPKGLVPEPVWINSAPAILLLDGDEIYVCFTLDLDDDGRIATIYAVRNPEKLVRLRSQNHR